MYDYQQLIKQIAALYKAKLTNNRNVLHLISDFLELYFYEISVIQNKTKERKKVRKKEVKNKTKNSFFQLTTVTLFIY